MNVEATDAVRPPTPDRPRMPSTLASVDTPDPAATLDPTARVTTTDCGLSDGRRLAYAVAGDPDGRPVLVHHGTPGSRLFAALLDGPARDVGARLLVPDRPGYGRSSSPPAGWSWTDWPAALDALRAAESLDEAAVLGFSGGGPFALATAEAGWVTRTGLVSASVPAAEAAFESLSSVPFALRTLFRATALAARVAGPSVVVDQLTDREVPAAVEDAIDREFHEALRQDATAPVRELRALATADSSSLGLEQSGPLRAWHGTRDGNAPIAPLRGTVRSLGGTVERVDADHLGTLLDRRREALEWLADP